MFLYQVQNQIFTGSPEHFFAMTGAEWIDEIKISPHEVLNADYPSKKEEILMDFILPLYRSYQQLPPKLFIRQGTGPGRHTLHALEAIPKGAGIVEYLGEWTSSTTGSSYRFGPIDGARYRNYGAMADDGFPNMGTFYLYGVDEIPLRVFFIALEDIAAGDMLTINYGLSHSVKTLEHEEYRLDAMRQFFLNNPLDHCLNNMRNLLSEPLPKWETILKLENLTAKVQYLYQTPSALEQLLFHNVLNKRKCFELYDKIDNRFYLLGYNSPANPRTKEVAALLEALR